MNPMSKPLAGAAACLVAAAVLLGSANAADEYDPFAAHRGPPLPTDRVIVKLRDAAAPAANKPAPDATDPAARFDEVGRRAGLKPRGVRTLAPRMALLELDPAAGETVAAAIARLRADPDVEFAEPDARMRPHRVPNDPGYAEQWFLQPSVAGPDGTTASAIDATNAWEITTGDPTVVVAVLDTGVRFDHPDLGRVATGGTLLPGYDFVGSVRTANDGDGWDADPSDPGDWISSADTTTSAFSGCPVEDSSWHGTRVSGIVAGLTDNATGIAGVGWNVRILPVRVLGKCGGFTSDIITGMRWAAGLAVDGVPSNPTPAQILNLSLGGQGDCSSAYQSAVDEIAATGAMVIASAGNDGSTVDQPANCQGVVSVTGVRHVGTKVGFSNLGPDVTISAPGGNCVNITAGAPCLYSLDTTTNLGTTTPGLNGYTDRVSNINVGTSFASPIVAGIAALMRSVNAHLTAARTIARLQATASPFPVDSSVPTCHVPVDSSDTQLSECNCTTETCGAGLANAAGAVADARRPLAAVSAPSAADAGATVVLNGLGSVGANGRTISSYAWTLVSGTTSLTAETGSQTSFVAPGASDTVVVRLTVADDLGLTDSTDAKISVAGGTTSPTPTPTPVPTPPVDTISKVSGGGGGGAIDPQLLLLLLALSGAGRAALRNGKR